MNLRSFRYFVTREDVTYIAVSKDIRDSIRAFAKQEGLTMVWATYTLIKIAFVYLGDKDSERRKKVIDGMLQLGKRAWERERKIKK